MLVAPAILWMALPREQSLAWRRLWMQGAVAAAYVTLRVFWRLQDEAPWQHAAGDPYRIALVGPHLAFNLARYTRWTARRSRPVGCCSSPLYVAICGIALFVGRRAEPLPVAEQQPMLVLAGWFGLGLLRTLFLPNHAYRYYFDLLAARGDRSVGLARAYRHPPAGPATGERAAGRRRGRRHRFVVGGVLPAASRRPRCAVCRRDQQPGAAWRTGAAGARCHPVRGRLAPRGATLVFDHIDIAAFGRSFGPRLWLADPNVQVLNQNDGALDPSRTAIFAFDRSGVTPAITRRRP